MPETSVWKPSWQGMSHRARYLKMKESLIDPSSDIWIHRLCQTMWWRRASSPGTGSTCICFVQMIRKALPSRSQILDS